MPVPPPASNMARQIAPDNLQANRGLVLSFLQLGRLTEAEQIGEEAVARWPRDAQLQHWLGLAYFKADKPPRRWRRCNGPKGSTAPGSTSTLTWRSCCFSKINPPRLWRSCKRPSSCSLRRRWPTCCWGGRIKNTNRTLRRSSNFKSHCVATPIRPSGTIIWHSPTPAWGATRKRSRNTRRNSRTRRKIPRFSTNSDTACWETGKLEEAITHLKKAMELDPATAPLPMTWAKLCCLLGMPKPRRPHYGTRLNSKPSDPSPHYQLARTLEKMGKADQARQEWQRFAELKKEQPEVGGMATGRPQ